LEIPSTMRPLNEGSSVANAYYVRDGKKQKGTIWPVPGQMLKNPVINSNRGEETQGLFPAVQALPSCPAGHQHASLVQSAD